MFFALSIIPPCLLAGYMILISEDEIKPHITAHPMRPSQPPLTFLFLFFFGFLSPQRGEATRLERIASFDRY